MRVTVIVVAAFSFAVSACGGPSRSPTPAGSNPNSSTAATSAAVSPSTSSSGIGAPPDAVGQVVNVTLSDALRIEPAQIAVRAGQPVTFQVTNLGALDHEFYLGDATAQAAHEAEMVATEGAVLRDAENVLAVQPGQTETLTYLFPLPGQSLAGCHVANHYVGGMRATITVTE